MVVILDLCERCFFKMKQPVTGDPDVHTDTCMSSQGPHLSGCPWEAVTMDTCDSDLHTCIDHRLTLPSESGGCMKNWLVG